MEIGSEDGTPLEAEQVGEDEASREAKQDVEDSQEASDKGETPLRAGQAMVQLGRSQATG